VNPYRTEDCLLGGRFVDTFYDEFCKVDFLCHAGEPNWLGWLVVALGAAVATLLIMIAADILSGQAS
jgi:hypothetical protein